MRPGRALGIAVLTLACADPAPTAGGRAADDPGLAIARQRAGLARILDAMDAAPEIYPAERLAAPHMLAPAQRASVSALWAEFADRLITLELLASGHGDFVGEQREHRFALHRAASLASYRFAMDFIERIERDPGLSRLLDEASAGIGPVDSAYARLKFRYLHLARASEFAALEAVDRAWRQPGAAALREAAAADAARIWKRVTYSGPTLTLTNGLAILEDGAHSLWLPIQERVARWMGEVRVHRSGEALISRAQIEAMARDLEPGDILLQRREWYLTNAGIPGFWTHAALYVGTPEERRRFFGAPEVERELRAANPQAYAESLSAPDGAPLRVLEAIAEGVRFTALEESAAADSIAVLRPRLGRVERAAALRRAFRFAGRPYDYDFDFLTDAALVCSELVYKAYQPGGANPGLSFPVQSVAGRLMMTPNEIARLFERERDAGAPQLDFVLMLDGDEGSGRARRADSATFAHSWRRPKWHIVTSRVGR